MRVSVRLDVDTKISDKLSMAFITCRAGDKIPALLYLARDAVSKKEQTIVFCATMKHVEYVVAIFAEAGLDCAFLYSQMDPTARKMNIARSALVVLFADNPLCLDSETSSVVYWW